MTRSDREAPEHRFIIVNGLRLHCLNVRGGGKPLVLLHGVTSNASVWRDLAPLMGSRRVAALDSRGHGDRSVVCRPSVRHRRSRIRGGGFRGRDRPGGGGHRWSVVGRTCRVERCRSEAWQGSESHDDRYPSFIPWPSVRGPYRPRQFHQPLRCSYVSQGVGQIPRRGHHRCFGGVRVATG